MAEDCENVPRGARDDQSGELGMVSEAELERVQIVGCMQTLKRG